MNKTATIGTTVRHTRSGSIGTIWDISTSRGPMLVWVVLENGVRLDAILGSKFKVV